MTVGRWDRNNPRLLGQRLETGRYYMLAGRLSAGQGEQTVKLFVNNGSAPVATLPFPVDPDADPSRMAIGQEHDAVEHPGKESFDGSLARMMIYYRPLSDAELRQAVTELQTTYSIDTDDGWGTLFDGQTLDGWRELPDADVQAWRVEDGTIVGGNGQTAVPKNTFLCTEQTFGDFEFRCQFKIEGDPETGLINSGIQFRSYVRRSFVTGYQADNGGPNWWGGIYDERRRGKLVASDMQALTPALYPDGWNNYLFRCVGQSPPALHQRYPHRRAHRDPRQSPDRGFLRLPAPLRRRRHRPLPRDLHPADRRRVGPQPHHLPVDGRLLRGVRQLDLK